MLVSYHTRFPVSTKRKRKPVFEESFHDVIPIADAVAMKLSTVLSDIV
jgi:hypothetical protein